MHPWIIARQAVLGALLAGAIGLAGCSDKPLEYPGGALPVPIQVKDQSAAVDWDDYRLEPVARFDATVLVLQATEHRGGSIPFSKLDFGVAWGTAVDDEILKNVRFMHRGRFLYWRTEDSDLYARRGKEITHQVGNFHLIASSDVLEDLKDVRRGDVVRLVGRLVNVSGPDRKRWMTSMTRSDTGAGACEIILVESLHRCTLDNPASCQS